MRPLLSVLAILSLVVLLTPPAAAQDSPALALSKSAYDEEVFVGDEAVFFIAVTNVGGAAATSVVVEDVLPAGLHFARAHATRGHYDAMTGLWSLDTLAAGHTETLELVTVLGTDTSVQNCAAAWTSGAGASETDCAVVRPKREKMVPLAAHMVPDSR